MRLRNCNCVVLLLEYRFLVIAPVLIFCYSYMLNCRVSSLQNVIRGGPTYQVSQAVLALPSSQRIKQLCGQMDVIFFRSGSENLQFQFAKGVNQVAL